MKIIWSEPTRQDLREIFDNIIEEDPHAVRALLKKYKIVFLYCKVTFKLAKLAEQKVRAH